MLGNIKAALARQVALDFAETQRRLAREHQTAPWKPRPVGACEQCGSWREDGQPPTVHFTNCIHSPLYGIPLRPNARSNQANTARTKRGAR